MIAWIALVLAVVAILLWLIVAYTLRRVWQTVGPQVTPLLAMFTPPEPEPEPLADQGDTYRPDPSKGFGPH